MSVVTTGARTSLSVLITNITLAGRSGTEIVTRDLALGLKRRGHRAIVYTQSAGQIAEEIRSESIPVVTSISEVSGDIDIIHAHHTPVAATAICRYPDVPAIFVAHDFVAWHDTPPLFPSIRYYVAVDATVAERLAAEPGVEPAQLRVLLNAVDTRRFQPGPPLPAKPHRALAYAKNLGHIDVIRRACAARKIAVDFVGSAVGKIIEAPESVLAGYDLVFASALSAIEAMATGRAVVVCDGRGLAGFATQQRARQWRPRNFGLRTLTRAVDDKALIEEIDAYDPKESADVCGFIREHANQENWLDDIEALHRETVAHHATSTASSAAMATARHVERWSPRADGSLPLVMRTTGIAAAAVPIGSGSVRPKLGMKCPWNEAVEESNAVLLGGFSAPEPWGTWLAADAAGAMLRLPKVQDGRDLALSFEIIPFTPRADLPLCVEVKVNGLHAATWSFSITEHGHKVSRLVRCPASQLHDRDHVWLSFDVRHACSPTDCGLGLDGRHLSIGLVGFTFR